MEPIKLDEEKISEAMTEMLDQKYEMYSAVITAWEELEQEKNAVKRIEAIIKLELKVIDAKMTIDMMNCKVITDKRYDDAIAGEITAEANYKIAMNEWTNYSDRFEKLKSDSYMIGKIG